MEGIELIKELDYKELEILIEEITRKVREDMITANRCGTLEEILKKYNYTEDEERWYSYPNTSRIIVIGSIEAKEKEVIGCLKNVGIDKNRVEFYTDYEKLPNINFGFLRNNSNYSDILVCALPHKMMGIGDNASFISMIENNFNEFPTLTKITDESGNLKYSNSAFKKALKKTNMFREINDEKYNYI